MDRFAALLVTCVPACDYSALSDSPAPDWAVVTVTALSRLSGTLTECLVWPPLAALRARGNKFANLVNNCVQKSWGDEVENFSAFL